jgi:hypothetical protein
MHGVKLLDVRLATSAKAMTFRRNIVHRATRLQLLNVGVIAQGVFFFLDMKHSYSIKTRLNRRPLNGLQK